MDPQRLYYLDAVRAFAMLLGIVLHAAIPFLPWRSWEDASWQSQILNLLMGAIHSFRMPLFFLLSGFFAVLLLQRMGTWGFVRHRLRRIALPFVAGYPVVLILMAAAFVGGWFIYAAGLDVGLREDIIEGLEEDSDSGFDLMHLWFLWYLMLFTTAFTVIFGLARKTRLRQASQSRMRFTAMVVIPLLGIIPYLYMPHDGTPEVDTTHLFNWRPLSYYFGYFLFGALMHGGNPRSRPLLIERLASRWKVLLVAGTILFIFSWDLEPWPVFCATQVAQCWCLCFGLIGLAQRYLSDGKYWVRYWSDASFFMYIMHLPLLIFLQGILAWAPLPMLGKFGALCVLTTAILYLSYRFLVRYTWIGLLLNGRRSRSADESMRASLGS